MYDNFWKTQLNDLNSFNNFFKKIDDDKTYDKIKSSYFNNTPDLEMFLNKNGLSVFEFCTSILSPCLSRSSDSDGILFAYSNLNANDTLFKIKYDGERSIFDFILAVKSIIKKEWIDA